MRAVVLNGFGDPDVLQPRDVEAPVRQLGELLVRVRACGVCGHDLLARRGELGLAPESILGHEIAGEVVDADQGSGVAPGDRVVLNQRIACGRCAACMRGASNLCRDGTGFYGDDLPGGYAEYVRATTANAVVLPPDMPFEVAATLPCGMGTGVHALRRLGLAAGETVVVTGATGGVGIHAVTLAAAMGARPIAVVRDVAAAPELRRAGAEHVLPVGDGRFHMALREVLTDGADAVVECVGTPTFAASLRCLRHGGRIAVVGNVEPGAAALPLGQLILKEIGVLGSSHATPADLARAVALVADGTVAPRVARAFPLSEAAAAHRFAESATTLGRVVLVTEEPS